MDTRPLIAIVGSVNETRKDYNFPIQNAEQARIVARSLGKALAENDFRILVYSGDPKYIECDVVQGYIEAEALKNNSIVATFAMDQMVEIEKFPDYDANASGSP